MPATDSRTATAITRELRKLWVRPMRLSTTITADGAAQITVGRRGAFHADALAPHLERATGRTWTFMSVRKLAGNGAAVLITYAPAEDEADEPTEDHMTNDVIATQLAKTEGRQAAITYLNGLGLTTTQLKSLAKHLSVAVIGSDLKAMIIQKIADATAGAREDTAAIHGAQVGRSALAPKRDASNIMANGPITAAALTMGTEIGCSTHNCPKRDGHDGDHDTTRFGWDIPETWTLADQMHFSRLLQHGQRTAQDIRFSLGLGQHVPCMFDEFDAKAGIDRGTTEKAITAFADYLQAVVALAGAQRIAKMHTDAPHYMGRPCGATEGKVTTSASDVKCNGCLCYIEQLGDCAEIRYDTRGDCDSGFVKVEFLRNRGHIGDRAGQTGYMCGSHAKQAAKANEVKIQEFVVNP